ncbi:hypothetical protein XELAEV_18016935mg [Xenopus laevis]|uniref:Uncharacterized protein n=1 Tax=Xenopus laevis TaxID=8355 RepID=A0A974DC73_XENLA|nr:hypothetical protein XELAEV_18016935mg [Xenopus laevis]
MVHFVMCFICICNLPQETNLGGMVGSMFIRERFWGKHIVWAGSQATGMQQCWVQTDVAGRGFMQLSASRELKVGLFW